MINYNLNPDEAVIVECKDVLLNNGKFVNTRGDLVLTSQNLIWVTKNMFGKVKNLEKYSIANVKVYDNKAQVKAEEKIGTPTKLSIFFVDSQMTFDVAEKKKARDLVNSINKLVTGMEDEIIAKSAIPGTAFVAETLKGTIGTFKNAMGIKAKDPEKVSQECPGCGASLSGIKGQAVKCPYCDSNVTLG